VQSNAYRGEASSQSSLPGASISSRNSRALVTTMGLIVEFFLRALAREDRPFTMGGPTRAPDSVPASIFGWRFRKTMASQHWLGQDLVPP